MTPKDLDGYYKRFEVTNPSWNWKAGKKYVNVITAKRVLQLLADDQAEQKRLEVFLFAVYKTFKAENFAAAHELGVLLGEEQTTAQRIGTMAKKALYSAAVASMMFFHSDTAPHRSSPDTLIVRELANTEKIRPDRLASSKSNILNDNALKMFRSLDESWLDNPPTDNNELNNLKAMIVRNLYFQKQVVTPETVRQEQARITAAQNDIRNIKIFSGRKVIVAAGNELLEDGNWRFFAPNTAMEIADQGGDLHVFRFGENTDENNKTKNALYDAIETEQQQLTIFLSTHGSDTQLTFADSTKKTEELNIHMQSLALVLKKRWENRKPGTIEDRDIIISEACFGHDYLRNLAEQLQMFGTPLPIIISAAEYGQLGWTNETSRNHSTFLDYGLGLIHSNKTTMGRVIDYEKSEKLFTNLTTYIPTGDIIMQIATNIRPQRKDDDEIQT